MKTVQRYHKQSLSSFDVFMRHVRIVGDKADVSGIFTRACFEDWVDTRNNTILHPNESFQRVLYAHIRASDNRKPFPEKVETALLKLLRKPKQYNPWERLFGNKKLGRKGFKRLGFHERKKSQASLKKKESSLTVTSCSTSDTMTSTLAKRDHREDFMNLNLDAWEMLRNAVDKSKELYDYDLLVENALTTGVLPSVSFVEFSLRQPPADNDLRFNLDFLSPSLNSCTFKKDRPIAELQCDKLGTIVSTNFEATLMFDKYLVGSHIYCICDSMILHFFICVRMVTNIMKHGVSWRREVLVTFTGRRIACLMRVELKDRAFRIQIQDHTDLFPPSFMTPLIA